MALSEVNRSRIIGMWEAGLSSEDIAQRIPCSISNVYKWIDPYRTEGEEGLKKISKKTIVDRDLQPQNKIWP